VSAFAFAIGVAMFVYPAAARILGPALAIIGAVTLLRAF
jgi:hypothetical protein